MIGRVDKSSGGASACDREGGGIIREHPGVSVIESVEESLGSVCM